MSTVSSTKNSRELSFKKASSFLTNGLKLKLISVNLRDDYNQHFKNEKMNDLRCRLYKKSSLCRNYQSQQRYAGGKKDNRS